MKELKTLKDFKRKQYSEGEDKKGNKIKFFDERELRQEAIKWIKDRKKILKNKTSTDLARMKAVGMIIDFEDFFNLQERI